MLKIISGGQTGADQGALEAAKQLGFPTGGCLPKGCLTLDGPRLDFIELYGMTEHKRAGYTSRTYDNVKNSDATIRFAMNFDSAGEICTKNAIDYYRRQSLDITISYTPHNVFSDRFDRTFEEVADWIIAGGYSVINVAGNSNNTASEMQSLVKEFMLEALSTILRDK